MSTPYRATLLLFLVLGLCACAARQSLSPPNAPRNEVQAFLDTQAEGTDEARAARFLVENLPLPDRLGMSGADLRENLDFAFLAWRTMPWGKKVPWDIFLHYVLPHRTSQEPFQPHRAWLFGELAPLCVSAKSMEEALSRISAWTLERVRYTPTSRRDLGVISVLDGGYGRCEELNILFMAAARSVGLPVRQALTPWWQHADGNHAWVEAWTGDGWHFLETSAFFSRLDQGWFAPQAARMAKVAAFAYGRPADPAIYRTGPGFALVDTTPAYTGGTQVRIRVSAGNHAPVAGREVYFSVWSAGGLRPVTKAVTDATGQARTVLGPGTFFVTCAGDAGLAHALLDTRDCPATTVTLFTASKRPLPQQLTFAFPGPGHATDQAVPDAERERRRIARDERHHPFLAGLSPDLRDHLKAAGQRIPDWLAALNAPNRTPWLEQLIRDLDDKDLLQAEPNALAASARLAQTARTGAAQAGLVYGDDIFVDSVLASRLYLEPWSDWRTELTAWSAELLDRPLQTKLRHVRHLLHSLDRVEGGYFGPMLTPGQILTSRQVRSDEEAGIMVTAGLRALGIPARMQADLGGVDYFDGQSWLFWPIRTTTDNTTGFFRLRTQTPATALPDFGLARVHADGYLDTLDDLEWNEDGLSCALRPGDYALFVPRRNGNETKVELRPFQIHPRVESSLDFPEARP